MRNSTRSAVDPFIVMDVMQAASAAEEAGRHIIHMEVGQPGTGAPKGAAAALAKAMGEGALGYTVALGLPAFISFGNLDLAVFPEGSQALGVGNQL